jgi:arylsulfatase A-like enzyme
MNVLYINTHDTGRMINVYGQAVITPNLQELGKDAIVFTEAFSCGPTCSPSRAALLTGLYPHQNGMLGLAQRGFSLTDPHQHLASYLNSQGYHTVISGLQHEVGSYLDINVEKLKELGYQDVLTTDTKPYKKEELCAWDRQNVIKAIEWLKSYQGNKPFMLTYGMHSTHRPFPVDVDAQIDARYVKPINPVYNNEENRSDLARFMTSVKAADENVGLLIKALKESGHYDDTIVIFTTDHGVAVPFNKCTLNDAGIGVSMILRVPGSKRNGTVYDGLFSQIDLFPTLCDLLAIQKPDYLQGQSFAELITEGKEIEDEAIFAEINFHTSYEPVRCVRTKRYKYICYYDKLWDKINLSNIDESQPKDFLMKHGLAEKHKYQEGLFDLYYDPEEQNNLCANPNYAKIKTELKAKLDEHLIETNDPILKGPLPLLSGYKVNKRTCLTASSKNPDDYEEV